jgi:hypothetical protein
MKKQLTTTFIVLSFILNAYSQNYSVDIPGASSLYAAQEQTLWCWAACNQMLLNAAGINESQSHQSVKVFGSVINKGAGSNFEQARIGLSGTYTDASGNSVKIVPYISYLSQRNPNDPLVIIDHLNKGIPLVMATVQHGRVCVGVDYVKNGQYYQITQLRLLDPFSNSTTVVTYTMQQFLQEGLIGFMTYSKQ